MLKAYDIYVPSTGEHVLKTVCNHHVGLFRSLERGVTPVNTTANNTCYICDMMAEAGKTPDESMEARDD